MDQEKKLKFARDLIKGRIAEVIFEQMVREEGRYAVIPFGYEHTLPTLAQYREQVILKNVMDNISNAPDFALISEDKTQVYLVEVKYRSALDREELKECAKKLCDRWEYAWLFVATPEGFYCERCKTVSNDGKLNMLSEKWVADDRQREYLKLLNEFERR